MYIYEKCYISKFFERDSAAKVDSNFQGGRVEALLHHGSPLRMLNHSIHMVSLSAWWVVGSWVDPLENNRFLRFLHSQINGSAIGSWAFR